MTHQIRLEAGPFSVEAINIAEGGSPDWHVALWRNAEQAGESTASFAMTCDEARTLEVALLLAAAREREGSRSDHEHTVEDFRRLWHRPGIEERHRGQGHMFPVLGWPKKEELPVPERQHGQGPMELLALRPERHAQGRRVAAAGDPQGLPPPGVHAGRTGARRHDRMVCNSPHRPRRRQAYRRHANKFTDSP